MATEYTATWRWTESGETASLTYNERSLPVAISTLRQAVTEGRIKQARLTASTVLYDSAAGIDLCPGGKPYTRSAEPWDGDAVKITGGTWNGYTGRVEHVCKNGTRRVRLDTTIPGIPGKLIWPTGAILQVITKEGT